MGLEFLFLLSLAVFLPVVSAAFAFAFWRKARAQRTVAMHWERYAAASGARYEPPTGEWPTRSSPVVSGNGAAGPYRLELLGTHGDTRTLVTVRREPVSLGEFVWHARAGIHEERPAGFADPLRTPDVQRMFQAFALHPSTELRYVRGAVELEWPGGEMSGARLDEARALAGHAALTLCPATRRSAS